jgi:transposase-like protein
MVGRAMIDGEMTCPRCDSIAVRKDGCDRKRAQPYRCCDRPRCFAAWSETPFSGYRFPPEIIALAERWYLGYRLSYADVAELLAERGVRVDPSSIYARRKEYATVS